MVGQGIIMPPRELLGWFTRPGECEAIAEWVRSARTDRVAVALDMLCYGGLVASRTLGAEPATAVERLGALRELRERRPEAVIYGFSTIMRLGKTVTCASDLEEHLLLRSYSQLLDRVERMGEAEARAELDDVAQQLDPSLLAEYLAVRRRNHAVNRAAVQLLADRVVDYLVLAQEDASPVGIHIPEQLALRDQIEEYRVADQAAITCGADEMAMVLLARHLTDEAGRAPAIAADYATESGSAIVAAFESRPLRETVLDHIGIAGGRSASPADCDAILFVHTPISAQSDIAEAPPPGQSPALAMQAESIVDRVEAAAAAGRLFGLADVAYCNGADPELVGALERRSALPRLGAFAGWNTAANTLGTVISQLCLMSSRSESLRDEPVRRFLASRLVDDHGYQTCVRGKAVRYAEQISADPFRLGGARRELEGFVSRQLEPLAHHYVSQLLGDCAAEPVRVSLPWGRLFEAEVEVGSLSSSAGPKNLQ